MDVHDLHENATNIQNAADSIVFAKLVLAALEAELTQNNTRQLQTRQILANARQVLTFRLTKLAEDALEDN